MKAVTFNRTGDSEVLQLADIPRPKPKFGEVLVKVAYSGVNPTDWKARSGAVAYPSSNTEDMTFSVPNQDGSGTIVEVGDGVDPRRVGERVWIWFAAYGTGLGTAQEFLALPSDKAKTLPNHSTFELGASIGIPALTAHRCLSLSEESGFRITKGSLMGKTILVHGGAGAVGHFAIQLGNWAGANIITTVSSESKAKLAEAAGAKMIVNYRENYVKNKILAYAPNGIDTIVEVAPTSNRDIDLEVLKTNGTLAIYANDGGTLDLPIRVSMAKNLNMRFVMVYTISQQALSSALYSVQSALDKGVLSVGKENGLPLHEFDLPNTAQAHDAVEGNAVGKVLVKVSSE